MHQDTYLVDKNSIHDICNALRNKLQMNERITFPQILPLLKQIAPGGEDVGSFVSEGIVNLMDLKLYGNSLAYQNLNGSTTGYWPSGYYNNLNTVYITHDINVIDNLPPTFLYNNYNIGSPAGAAIYKYHDIVDGNAIAYVYCKNNIVFSDRGSFWYNSTYDGKLLDSDPSTVIHGLGNEYAKYMYNISNGFNQYWSRGEDFGYSCGQYTLNMSAAYYFCNSTLFGDTFKCGNNVIDLRDAYYGCEGTVSTPVVGPNVVCAQAAYYDCYNAFGDVDLTQVENCGEWYMTFGWCHNLNTIKMPNFNVNRVNLISFARQCNALQGNFVVRSKKSNFSIQCGSTLESVTWLQHIVLYCSNFTGSLNLSEVNYFRTNIFFNNYDVYNNFNGNQSRSSYYEIPWDDDSVSPDIEEVQIEDLVIKPVRYKYNSMYNIYAYCIE